MPITPGEDKAWEVLASLDPADVCRAAAATYDAAAGAYRIKSFGMDFEASVRERTLASSAPGSQALLGKLGYFFRLSALWYLVHAKEIGCTGRFVNLQGIRGGEIFSRGSHVLPLEPLAARFGSDRQAFLARGLSLGGMPEQQGDAALRLHPLPRIPAVLSLWLADDEFPARADLLFDSTCELQIPTDIIWSVAMLIVLIMLE